MIGGLIFSMFGGAQAVQAQQISFPAQMNKSFTPLSIEPGGTSRLLVTIFNPNLFELTNAAWTDNLVSIQPGIFIANPANVSNNCGGSVTATPGSTTLSLSGGTVPPQVGSTPGSCTVALDVSSVTAGNLINTIPANALHSNGNGGTVTNTTPASATLHVDVIQSPTLSKSFTPNTMLVGQVSQLSIRIRNNDLDTALAQTSVTDQLPANVILANPAAPSTTNCGSSALVTATSGGSSVTLSNATIPANSVCTIRVNVTSTVAGAYTNNIPAGTLHTQQGVTNGAPASAVLNVQDIGLSKSFSPPRFQAGGTSTLSITLSNPTNTAYTGVQLSDTLPGTVLTVVDGSATTTCGGTVSTSPPRTVSLTNGRVPAGSSSTPGTCIITVQVTAPANANGATFTNTIPVGVLVTDQHITNGIPASARVSIYTVGGGISATKSFSPATILPGANSRLRINITAPPDTDLTNFSIVDDLPADVTISNSSPATQNNCGASSVITATTGGTTVTLSNGTIRAGTTCQINVFVTSSTPGVHTNTIPPGNITNNENRTVPNPLTANLTVQAVSDISISKSFTPPTVSPGGISTLRITLQNTNAVPLVNVSVSDPLPGSLTDGIIVAPTPNASTTCTGGTVSATPGSQTISMSGGTIPAQVAGVPGICTIRVDVQGLGSRTSRTNTIPTANVSGTIQGTSTTINPAQPARATLTIGSLSIGVVKGFDPLTVFGGSASTLSVQLINPNNVELNGVSFTDGMPSGMIIANPANPDVGTCGGTINATPGESSFALSGATIAASSSCVMTVRVTMTVNGNLTNVIDPGAVTSFSGASNPDPAAASLTNLPGASITKAFAPHTIRPGAVASLTFTIQNTGTVPLTGMGFTDTLPGDPPVGLVIANSPASDNHCGGTLTADPGTQRIALTNGTLALNASCTIVVSVTGDVEGSYTNTIEAGNLHSTEGATNHDATSDTLVISVTSSGGGGGGGGGRGKNNGGSSSAVSGFVIPVTGFAPDVITPLAENRPLYEALGMTIEIPDLHLNTSIVGVQIKDGHWDVSWLQDKLGWLNGTAYPTWKGNSVLTGHVVNADGKPGIFSRLKSLNVGEYIYVYSNGYRYTYQVKSNELVDPGDATALRHEKDSYLTLITCDTYDEKSATYSLRVAVHAKLVDMRLAK
jgi:LPXTG-site transpeptidase (sortase) family protein